ncbi:ABC transporter permease [Kutzneria albida]|uniref:Exporter of polyketide antibiotics n=1 Tax=Kutzneria albida DSM 43870 TaxID=1449976 RepID=W5W8F5_9PSEU|nr:ABC transporter permease [Kutzneria albida]AHH94509.1 exporter of polyketide antibiotics [Kutzneria albida DSM 43870]
MNTLVGTGFLTRLVLRRERVQLTAWLAVIALLAVGTEASFAQLYPTQQGRAEFAASLQGNPVFLALTGPMFDLTTLGGMTAWRVAGIGSLLAAFMAVFTVVRHTRADEENGRLELLGAGVVGRRAPLTAPLLTVFGAGLVLAVVVGGALTAKGLPAAGSFALGLGFAGAAWVFGALAAVTAQLSQSARAATGIAAGVVVLTFLMRALGDSTGADWLSWISPIGWTQQVRAFADERWWVLALPLVTTSLLVALAYVLVARRDLGGGLLATRPGPARASASLRGSFGLAWRLHRASLLSWLISVVVLGLVLGALAESVSDVLRTSDQLQRILAALGGSEGVVDLFLAAMLSIVGLVGAVYAVQSTLRARGEESAQRAEPVLTASVGRTRWFGGHLVFAFGGTALLMAVVGAAMGLAHGLRAGDLGGELPRVLAGALVQIPAAWVLAGLAAALTGVLPRAVGLAWAVLVVFFLLGQLGQMLQLSQWLLDVSPFTHVPKLPGGEFTAQPLCWMVAVTVVLTAVGLIGFRRRDLG